MKCLYSKSVTSANLLRTFTFSGSKEHLTFLTMCIQKVSDLDGLNKFLGDKFLIEQKQIDQYF